MLNKFSNSDPLMDIINNPWITIISILIGLTSISLAIYFYYKSKKEKKPYYYVSTQNLISGVDKFEYLDLYYNNEKIPNFSSTTLSFWNEGRETINKEDVADADPISFNIKNGKVLKSEVLKEINPSNRFSLSISPNSSSVRLIFDYIDQNEGVKVEIIHTGRNIKDYEVTGTIKGVGKPSLKSPQKFTINWQNVIFNRFFGIFLALMLLIILIFDVIPSEYEFLEIIITFSVFIVMFIALIGLLPDLIEFYYDIFSELISNKKSKENSNDSGEKNIESELESNRIIEYRDIFD